MTRIGQWIRPSRSTSNPGMIQSADTDDPVDHGIEPDMSRAVLT
jgi:hypothetical protein